MEEQECDHEAVRRRPRLRVVREEPALERRPAAVPSRVDARGERLQQVPFVLFQSVEGALCRTRQTQRPVAGVERQRSPAPHLRQAPGGNSPEPFQLKAPVATDRKSQRADGVEPRLRLDAGDAVGHSLCTYVRGQSRDGAASGAAVPRLDQRLQHAQFQGHAVTVATQGDEGAQHPDREHGDRERHRRSTRGDDGEGDGGHRDRRHRPDRGQSPQSLVADAVEAAWRHASGKLAACRLSR